MICWATAVATRQIGARSCGGSPAVSYHFTLIYELLLTIVSDFGWKGPLGGWGRVFFSNINKQR